MAFALAIRLALPMGAPTGGGPHPVAPWLLQAGVWNDAGVWLDSATWTEWLINGGVWADIGVWADSLTWEDGTSSFAGGANFDGATSLLNAALTAVDNDLLTFSFWAKYTGTPYRGVMFVADPAGEYVNYLYLLHADAAYAGKGLFWGSGSSDFVDYVDIYAPDAQDGPWHNYMGAVNTTTGAFKLYIDDVDVGVLDTQVLPVMTMDYNGLPFQIGWDGYLDPPGSIFTGDMAEVWIAPGQFIDLTVQANRRKFLSAGGSPVDLGSDGATPTGTAPAVYLHRSPVDAASAFATNRGTGGSFATTGTLTASSTNP